MNVPLPFIAISISICAVLAGCETTPTNPDAATVSKLSSTGRSGSAAAVIYRPGHYAGSMLSPTIQIDGKDLVDIDNGRVCVVSIPPGHHVFNVDNQDSRTEVTLRPGSKVYLKVVIIPGMWKGNGEITQVVADQGESEAKRLKLIDPSQIAPGYR
jgi:hypothetical protein